MGIGICPSFCPKQRSYTNIRYRADVAWLCLRVLKKSKKTNPIFIGFKVNVHLCLYSFEETFIRSFILISNKITDTPRGIRIPVSSVKGRCPRPLDDGGYFN